MSRFAFLALGLVVVSGCGGGASDAPSMFEVTGTVTFDGKPLEKGSIVFDSADGQTKAAAGGIENGKFSFESPLGPKTVRISATRETGQKDEYGETVSESYIPAKYNAESKLEATVERSGENKFDYALDPK